MRNNDVVWYFYLYIFLFIYYINMNQELDLTGIPPNCLTSFTPIYNDYKAQKTRLTTMINVNNRRALVEKVLDAVVKRLDNLRSMSTRGDIGPRGCQTFEGWYTQTRAWFISEFDQISNLLAQYNQERNPEDRALMPLDIGRAFIFGGKHRRTKTNKKKTRKGYIKNKKQTRHRKK